MHATGRAIDARVMMIVVLVWTVIATFVSRDHQSASPLVEAAQSIANAATAGTLPSARPVDVLTVEVNVKRLEIFAQVQLSAVSTFNVSAMNVGTQPANQVVIAA
jgi:hypothetical protein